MNITRLFGFVLVLGSMLALGACGTVAGVGQDVSTVGQTISGSSHAVQQHMY